MVVDPLVNQLGEKFVLADKAYRWELLRGKKLHLVLVCGIFVFCNAKLFCCDMYNDTALDHYYTHTLQLYRSD